MLGSEIIITTDDAVFSVIYFCLLHIHMLFCGLLIDKISLPCLKLKWKFIIHVFLQILLAFYEHTMVCGMISSSSEI